MKDWQAYPHRRELKQAVLVKLLNKTHPFGLFATVVIVDEVVGSAT